MKRSRGENGFQIPLPPAKIPFPSLLPHAIPFSPTERLDISPSRSSPPSPSKSPHIPAWLPPLLPSRRENRLFGSPISSITTSTTPLESVSNCPGCPKREVRQRMLSEVISYPHQIVYCEKKTWFPHTKSPNSDPVIELSRGLSLHAPPSNLPPLIEIIGAHGLPTSPLPFHNSTSSSPNPIEIGQMGLISYLSSMGEELSSKEIVRWVKENLCPSLCPFPGPRSVVVMEEGFFGGLSATVWGKIQFLVSLRGALLLKASSPSPFGMFEQLWQVVGRRLRVEVAGKFRRGVGMKDLLSYLNDVRVPSEVCMMVIFGGTCGLCARERGVKGRVGVGNQGGERGGEGEGDKGEEGGKGKEKECDSEGEDWDEVGEEEEEEEEE